MMAAAARRRGRPPQPRPAAPPPESRRNLRPRRRRLLLNDDHYGFSSSSDEEEEEEEEEEEKGEEIGRGEQGRRRKKVKLVLKLPHLSPVKKEPPPPPPPPSPSPPPPTARSSRPRRAAERRVSESPPSSPPSASSSSYVEDEDDDEEEERKCAEEEEEEEEEEIKPLKKRRIDRCRDRIGSERSRHREIEKKRNVVRRSNGSISGSGTRLPERNMLEAILDKLQKKDTYGVFAQPVDPEELPDYHDVIDHPMDFGTIRKKLARNLYRSFEQFEDDVFLICNNAMQYNAPDTIYFRQARSIQDMARNKFQELRDDGLCTGKKLRDDGLCNGKKLGDDALYTRKKLTDDGLCTEEKNKDDGLCTKNERKDEARVKVESLENQQVEKGFCRNRQEPLVSDISSAATLASAGEAFTGLSTAQANDVEPSMVVDKSVDNSSSPGESKSEKLDELPARGSPSKPVRLPLLVDENRRATYHTSDEQPKTECDSIFDVLACEPRQLVAVELHMEYSYARSLARFAATLGPIAWKIASERIEKVLPSGVKFGPGWVGEYEPLPTAIISLENHSQAAKKTKENEHRPKAVAISGLSKNINGPKSRVIGKSTNRVSNSKEERNNDGNAAKPKQRLFGVIAEPQTRSNGIMLQPKKEQDCFASSLSSPSVDTVPRRPEHSEAAASRVSDTVPFLKANGQPKLYINQPDGVSPRTRSNHIGIDLGGSSGEKFSRKSDTIKPTNDLGFISKHPQRMAAGNFLSHSSQHHHEKDPAKLVSFSSPKFSQPGNSKSFINTSEKLNSSLRSTVRENHQWISAVAPAGIRPSINSPSFLNSHVRPPFYSNPAAKNVVQFMKQPVQGVSEEPHVRNRGLVIFPQLIPTEIPRSNGCSQEKKNKDTLPPDLNISFPIQGSPVRQSSGIHLDAQQPDLALQL